MIPDLDYSRQRVNPRSEFVKGRTGRRSRRGSHWPVPLRFLIPALFVFSLLLAGYQLAQGRLDRPEVKNFLEDRAGKFLKTEVRMDRIRYLPPLEMALEGIQTQTEGSSPAFSLARMERLVFGYGLINLIRRDFKTPTTFELDSPEIHFRSFAFQLPFLDSVSSPSSSKSMPAKLVVRGGKFHYPWSRGPQEIVLSKVRFKAMPDARGRIQLELASELQGIAEGSIRVRGFTDASFRRYELEVTMENVTFLPGSGIPLRKIRGTFQISDQTIRLGGLTSFFHDWEVGWRGTVENWQTEPRVAFEITNQKSKTPFRLSVSADFKTHQLGGEWSWLGRSRSFSGEAERSGDVILFSKLNLPDGYRGRAEFRPASGDYELTLSRGPRRFRIHSNVGHLEFETDFRLDHARVNHLDCVVSGHARFAPLPPVPAEENPRFKGEVETDYFILEYEPLEDFRGSFEASTEGLNAIDFQWGKGFHLGGRVLFKGGESREDLTLRVEEVPLDAIKEFAGRSFSSKLAGELEGKLKLRGNPKQPEVQGYFTIKEGMLDKLDFDRAIIQFQGFPPYLRLYDSKIFRGRNTLRLIGAIDLTLPNLLHGIQVKGPDSLVIWKGMSAYWEGEKSAIRAEKAIDRCVVMGLEVGRGASDSDGQDPDPDESHAAVGPKVRF